MASISAIRDALAAQLQTITDLHAYDTIPGTIQTPAAIVEPDEPFIQFDSTMGRGSDDLAFTVLVLAQEGTIRTAQDDLDGYLATAGARSVKAAVDGDLGGVVSFARVVSAGGYGQYEFNGISYAGVRFKIEVTT